MNKLKILVTGAGGFIGSRFMELNSDRHELTAVSLRNTRINQINCTAIDAIVHFAGLAHQMEEIDPSLYFKVNRDLTLELANKAKAEGVKHFVYISTTKVYGDGGSSAVYTEKSRCVPGDPYGKSKFEAEQKLQALASDHFTVSIIRPPLVYGPGVKGNLLLFIKLALLPLPLPFKGINNNRAMVYVDNLIALIAKILERRADGIFTLTDVDQISTEMLMVELRKNLGKKSNLFYAPLLLRFPIKWLKPAMYSRLFGSFNIDCSYTLESLNYQNPVSFTQGVKAMVEHYKAHHK